MIMEEENRPELADLVEESMKQVAQLRIRFGGKTIPPEKFAITKAAQYLKGKIKPVLPAYDLFYAWNIFGNCSENAVILDPIMARIESKMKQIRLNDINDEQYFVLLLFKGICLRHRKRSDEALECFIEIIQNQDYIEIDTYVPPHAAFELAMTYIELGNVDDGKLWLEKARDEYSGFLIEVLIHVRIHATLAKLKHDDKLSKNNFTR